MPKVVINDSQGLVQQSGSGFEISSSVDLGGAAKISSTFGLTNIGAKTAGTTQTEAGSTAITNVVTVATVSNANDGLKLPAGVAGDIRIISNISANAAKVYTNGTDKINGSDPGASGNATVVVASKTTIFVFTGDDHGWATIISA
ncbi:MAG: hypothetical protein EBU90_17210 [Proteobacteria bacterium]|nr:hypothetical protein [Pseudomonadota bacterium]